MPLSQATLKDGLGALFGPDGQPASEAEAGEAWAKAYAGYAGGAVAGPTTPLPMSLQAARTTLAAGLAGAFAAARAAGPAGAGVVTAALDVAFAGFWLAPPVAFAAPGIAGVVTVAPPGVLTGALGAVLASGVAGAGADAQAAALATALDGWTRTVLVVNTTAAGPQPPVPLT